MTFDEFKQSMIGICDQKTIITTNPGYYVCIVLRGMCTVHLNIMYAINED